MIFLNIYFPTWNVDSDNKGDKLTIQEGATSSFPSTSQELLDDKLQLTGKSVN